jgi:hypothetical protein
MMVSKNHCLPTVTTVEATKQRAQAPLPSPMLTVNVVAPASEHRRPPCCRLIVAPPGEHPHPTRQQFVVTPVSTHHRPTSCWLVIASAIRHHRPPHRQHHRCARERGRPTMPRHRPPPCHRRCCTSKQDCPPPHRQHCCQLRQHVRDSRQSRGTIICPATDSPSCQQANIVICPAALPPTCCHASKQGMAYDVKAPSSAPPPTRHCARGKHHHPTCR